MKKVLAIVAIVAFAASFSACKKDYTCCYYDSAGVKIATAGYGCTTTKMSKKDKEDLESTGTAAASLLGWTFKCE